MIFLWLVVVCLIFKLPFMELIHYHLLFSVLVLMIRLWPLYGTLLNLVEVSHLWRAIYLQLVYDIGLIFSVGC